jgi:hypothetical protein
MAKLEKLLSTGLSAWINFERACKRTELLSETYLSVPIAQILSSHTDGRVISEFRHPVLAPLVQGVGRKPTTDFVVCDHDNNVSVAVETKWVGRTQPHPQKVLWDLIRLELIRSRFNAECFFIIAGQGMRLRALAEIHGFKNTNSKGRGRPLLRLDSNSQNRVRLDSSDSFRRPMLRKLYRSYQHVDFPTALATKRSSPFPNEVGSRDHQVIVWKLVPTVSSMFRPTNNLHFHINPIER